MTNKEKYAQEIANMAAESILFAVDKKSGEVVKCSSIRCRECLFRHSFEESCSVHRKEWANSEYIEKPKISKKDKMFLECLNPIYKYIYKDADNGLVLKGRTPHDVRFGGTYLFNVEFPMVKWDDEEPWKIEDLKNLEVVEEYEDN